VADLINRVQPSLIPGVRQGWCNNVPGRPCIHMGRPGVNVSTAIPPCNRSRPYTLCVLQGGGLIPRACVSLHPIHTPYVRILQGNAGTLRNGRSLTGHPAAHEPGVRLCQEHTPPPPVRQTRRIHTLHLLHGGVLYSHTPPCKKRRVCMYSLSLAGRRGASALCCHMKLPVMQCSYLDAVQGGPD
jgi:hypothetical protein